MLETDEKVRENRLRRMADRQGLRLRKSRRRDPRAIGYGTYMLWIPERNLVEAGCERLTLDQVEAYLTAPERPSWRSLWPVDTDTGIGAGRTPHFPSSRRREAARGHGPVVARGER